MNFEVAIPSYGRPEKLKNYTLDYLRDERFDYTKITIFVASEEEKISYERALIGGYYGKIVVGVVGLCQQLNFIRQYYPDNTPILRMDDDVKNIKLLNPRPFLEICNQMFDLASKEGCRLWSIYPCNNLFFCKERIIVGKVFCVGCINGFFNDKNIIYPDVSSQEDRWLSLTCFVKDGKTMRYEGACPDTVYFTASGLSEYRKLNHEKNIQLILDSFPNICEKRLKKNGFTDINWKTKKEKVLYF